jgi:hypothetical protein
MDSKRNQIIIQQNIKKGIIRAVRKILPISMILKEYLVNSINIIQEPAKVELIGKPEVCNLFGEPGLPVPVVPVKEPPGIFQPRSEKRPVTEPKNNGTKLENEIMNIIKTDGVKTDKQKIQDLMNIDKIITSIEPKLESLTKKYKSEHPVSPYSSRDRLNHKLSTVDKEILDVNVATVEKPRKSVSGTTMSLHSQYRLNPANIVTSERIDPDNIELIEDYGVNERNYYRPH